MVLGLRPDPGARRRPLTDQGGGMLQTAAGDYGDVLAPGTYSEIDETLITEAVVEVPAATAKDRSVTIVGLGGGAVRQTGSS